MDRTPAQSTRSKSGNPKTPAEGTPQTERKSDKSFSVSKVRKNLLQDFQKSDARTATKDLTIPVIARGKDNPFEFADLDETDPEVSDVSPVKRTPAKSTKCRKSPRRRNLTGTNADSLTPFTKNPEKQAPSANTCTKQKTKRDDFNPIEFADIDDTENEVYDVTPSKGTTGKRTHTRKSPCRRQVTTSNDESTPKRKTPRKKRTASKKKRIQSTQNSVNSSSSDDFSRKQTPRKHKILRFQNVSSETTQLKGILKTPEKSSRRQSKTKKTNSGGRKSSQGSVTSSQASLTDAIDDDTDFRFDWMMDAYVFQRKHGNAVGFFVEGKMIPVFLILYLLNNFNLIEV